MPRRRSDELMAEADRLVAQAKEQRARERKLERQADDHRCRLLGRALTRIMRTDANLRARMKITMQGYCKGDRDREVFGLDLSETWFETLTAPIAARATTTPPEGSDSGGLSAEVTTKRLPSHSLLDEGSRRIPSNTAVGSLRHGAPSNAIKREEP